MRGTYLPLIYTVIFHQAFSSVWVQLSDSPIKDKFITGKKLRAVHPCGYQQCKKQCERRTDCSHVNFISHNFTCLLMSSNSQSALEVREGTVYHVKNNSGICSDIGCTAPFSTCIRTKPGSDVCLKDLIHCKNKTYSVLNGTKICIQNDNTSRIWEDAKDFCSSTDGRLPVIDTEIKFNRMMQFVNAQAFDCIWLSAWIDANMTWRWDNGNSVETGEAWSVVDEYYGDQCLGFYEYAFHHLYAMECSYHCLTLCEEI